MIGVFPVPARVFSSNLDGRGVRHLLSKMKGSGCCWRGRRVGIRPECVQFLMSRRDLTRPRQCLLTVQLRIVVKQGPCANEDCGAPRAQPGGQASFGQREPAFGTAVWLAADLCVIAMLSFPLKMSCFPPAPAIRASKDWAYVRMTLGPGPDGRDCPDSWPCESA